MPKLLKNEGRDIAVYGIRLEIATKYQLEKTEGQSENSGFCPKSEWIGKSLFGKASG